MGQPLTTLTQCGVSCVRAVAPNYGDDAVSSTKVPTHDTHVVVPPTPSRCCLPQFDPSVRGRLLEVQEATIEMPICKERQAPKSKSINRDRNYRTAEFVWVPMSNGMSFDFPIPQWEKKAFCTPTSQSVLTTRIKSNLNTSTPYMFVPQHPPPLLDDEEFVRCRLNGPHPNRLVLVQRRGNIPKSFHVVDRDVLGLMDKYDTLQKAINAKCIYLIDYSKILASDKDAPLKVRPGSHLCTPCALFFCGQGKLRPLAIQLHCDESSTARYEPVYTPQDSLWAWTLAKLYFNHADMHVHLAVSLIDHTIMLPCVFNLCMQRNLSLNHPVRQFMSHHLHASIPFFNAFLDTLEPCLSQFLSLTREGITVLASTQWRLYDFTNFSFQNDCLQRMDSKAKDPIKSYPYIEDGTILWKAIESHVRAFIRTYYEEHNCISDDHELASFIGELAQNIPRFMELNPSRGFEPIVFDLTTVIFAATGMFSAFTLPMVPPYLCVEAFPGFVQKAPPNKAKDTITHEDYLAGLPPQQMASMQCAAIRVLSNMIARQSHHFPKVTLGLYMSPVCHDRSVEHRTLKHFEERLNEAAKAIEAKWGQGGTNRDYLAMHPKYVPQAFGCFIQREFDGLRYNRDIKYL